MSSLGIDYKLLIGQIINFLILLLILWRFAYRPLLKMLNDRRDKVAKSLADAKQIEEKLAQTEENTRKIMADARSEASAIIEESAKAATAEKKEIVAKAKSQAEKEINRAKVSIGEEKELAAKSLEKEMTKLLALATEKILGQVPEKKLQEEAIGEAIKELGKK